MPLIKLTRRYRSLIGLAFLFGAATVAMNLGLQSTSSYLIAKAAQHPSTILLLWTPIVAVRFFGTARAAFRYLDRYFAHDVTLRWLRDLKTHLYQAIERETWSVLKGRGSGEILSRLGHDVDSLENLIIGFFEPVIIAILGLLMVLAIGLWLNPLIALGLTVMLVVSATLLSWSAFRMAKISRAQQVDLKGRLTAALVELLYGSTDIRALHLEGFAKRHVDQLQQRLHEAKRHLIRITGLFSATSLFVTWAGMWVVLQVSIMEAQRHQLRPIFVPVVALLALASFEIVSGLPSAFQDVSGLAQAAARIRELRSREESQSYGKGRSQKPPEVPALVVKDVSLVLGDRVQPILDRVTLTLAPGQHVALIGPNGSGKSSLVNLLASLLAYNEGSIQLDQTELREWDTEAARRLFGVVNQFPHIFHDTLRANLQLAAPDASEDALLEALRLSGMLALVNRLPKGLDTLLGERGTTLSGGEIKRLAIARAVLKNAPILLLDEPTEGLDPISERTVMEDLMQWASRRSVLWITHSAINLDLVDEVVVLMDGRIVDHGTPRQVASHPVAQSLLRLALLSAHMASRDDSLTS
ncbi:thiol reductant ABC exporter subunit CydC [Sulfobacillus harzensis]|uniref:Thiol reductant ABC exporter subunit CydC n=1 Tax=Sulfobacillus harzensis TaxID=2729629 RepID=A0A7Y0L4D2_9FIRM|nr:thiol reductant ABC exporter subunit CydC [Sulfobacillus harzensis]NMP23091.1 thiol reductant ABC exporter subunit CydC [Sulfobacillus harzensis]